MLVRNWYTLWNAGLYINNRGIITPYKLTSTSGSKTDLYMTGSTSSSTNAFIELLYGGKNGYIGNYSNTGRYFGSGTTPSIIDDYKLENPITSGLTVADTTHTVAIDGDYIVHESVYVLSNTSDAEITVGEIGNVINVYKTNNTRYCALVDRTVLDVPVVIPAGGNGTVTYTTRYKSLVCPE